MKIHTFYKLFPKLLTSYVNVHIVFIFNFILSYSPKVLVRCRLGCLTCIATQKLNNFSHLFSPDPPSFPPSLPVPPFLLLGSPLVVFYGLRCWNDSVRQDSFLLVTCFVCKHLPSRFTSQCFYLSATTSFPLFADSLC